LSGRQAALHTGHCVIDTSTGDKRSRLVSAKVDFGSPSDAELAAYAATDEPLALAGAFSIEGLSGPFVNAVHGSPSNVLGLSLPDFREMLFELGVEVVDLWRSERTERGTTFTDAVLVASDRPMASHRSSGEKPD
jgi:septum formation protein